MPTVAGPLGLSWQRRGGGTALAPAVPVNASATVRPPASEPSSVREGGRPVARASGVTVVSVANGSAVLAVGSGSYRFTSV